MAAFAIDRKLWRNAVPGRRYIGLAMAVFQHLKPAHFVELGSLGAGIGHEGTLAAHLVTSLKLLFGVCALTNGDHELPGLTGNGALEVQHIAEVAVAPLVEGAQQPNAGLYRENRAVPRDLAARLWRPCLSTR